MARALSAPGVVAEIRRVDSQIDQLTLLASSDSDSEPFERLGQPAARVALRAANQYRHKLDHAL
jgi:hypothetical protein